MISSLTEASKSFCSAILRLDGLLLRGLLGHDPRLILACLLEIGPARLDLLAIPLDRLQDPRVLARDALDGVEPRDDVVEALRAEDHLERRVALPVDVQVAQSLGDALLRDDEALLRRGEVLRVRREVGVDLSELDVRVVPGLDRLLELGVHAVDLGHDRLGLLALRGDRLPRCRSNGKQEPGGSCHSDKRLSAPIRSASV